MRLAQGNEVICIYRWSFHNSSSSLSVRYPIEATALGHTPLLTGVDKIDGLKREREMGKQINQKQNKEGNKVGVLFSLSLLQYC